MNKSRMKKLIFIPIVIVLLIACIIFSCRTKVFYDPGANSMIFYRTKSR